MLSGVCYLLSMSADVSLIQKNACSMSTEYGEV